MSKKGSALMQVMVIGLIIAAFAVMMLRYAVTRSANLSRTERILSSQIVADSCLDQYMAFQATAELSGEPPCFNLNMDCLYITGNSGTTVSSITMNAVGTTDIDNSYMIVTTFTVPVNAGQ